MDGDLPWAAPAPYLVVGRRWKYAPPPWVVFDAVVEEMERWLTLLTDEAQPRVAASRRPDSVLLDPWLNHGVKAVELRIERHGGGSSMRVLAYGDVPQLDDEARRWVRYRLGTVFGEALRDWIDH